MNFIVDFISLLILFFVQTIIFIGVGSFIYSFPRDFYDNYCIRISTAYFIGLLFSISIISILCLLFNNFSYSVFSTIFLFLFLLVFRLQPFNFPKINIYLILFSILILFLFIFRSTSFFPSDYFADLRSVNPFEGFGTVVHSFRAANIAEHILFSNSIPVLNQNIGQSLLASSMYLYAHIGLQAILVFQLSFCMSFMILLFYGHYLKFITVSNSKFSNLFFCLFIFGSPSLSFFYSSVLDTESIIFLISNVDTVIGLSLFLIFLGHIYSTRSDIISIGDCFFIFLNGFFWNLFASQNVIIMMFLLIFMFFLVHKFHFSRIKILLIIFIFTLSSLIGSQVLGGFLKMGYINHSIPGLMSVSSASSHPLVEFRIPRLSESGSSTYEKFKYFLSTHLDEERSDISSTISNDVAKTFSVDNKNIFFVYFGKILLSIKLLFYPILAICLIYFLRRASSSRISSFPSLIRLVHSDYFLFIYHSSVFLFVVGSIISSCFIFRGYTFELSKFLSIGLFFMMFIVSLLANGLLSVLSKTKIYAILVILLLPSFLEVFVMRTFHPLFSSSFFESLQLLFSLSGTFGLNR